MGTGLLLTVALGASGDLRLLGAVSPVLLIQQVVIGVLQQGIGDAVLLPSRRGELGHREVLRRGRLCIAWGSGLCLIGALAGVGCSLLVDPSELRAASLVAVGGAGFAAAEVVRLAGIAAGRQVGTVLGALAQLLAVSGVAVWRVFSDRGDVVLLIMGAGIVSAMISCICVRVVPGVRGSIALWREVGYTATAAGRDSLWGTGGAFVVMQLIGVFGGPELLGTLRAATQFLSPLLLVAIVVRRSIVSSGSDRIGGPIRGRFIAVILLLGMGLAVGIGLLSTTIPSMEFLPPIGILLLAGVERALACVQQVESGRLLKRGYVREMLQVRRIGAIAGVVFLVPSALIFGAAGCLVAGCALTVHRLIRYRAYV